MPRKAVGYAALTHPTDSLSLRQPLKTWHAFGDVMERLLVDGVDRDLRAAEQRGIVERADLDDHHAGHPRSGDHVGAAFGAEFARYRLFQIAAAELFRRSLGIFEAIAGQQHEHVGRAAGDILAFAAMALRLH